MHHKRRQNGKCIHHDVVVVDHDIELEKAHIYMLTIVETVVYLGHDKAVCYQDRIQETVVEEMIDIVPPFNESGISVFPERSIETVGDILQDDHE